MNTDDLELIWELRIQALIAVGVYMLCATDTAVWLHLEYQIKNISLREHVKELLIHEQQR